MRSQSCYMLLGVSRQESPNGIRRAFRELVKRYHPDRTGTYGLRFFGQIVDAYRMLADPGRRRDYDRGLSDARPIGRSDDGPILVDSEPARAQPPQVSAALRCRSFSRHAFESALARIAKDWTMPDAPPRADWQAIDLQAILSPDDALRGGFAAIAIPTCIPCEDCSGSGRDGDSVGCAACDGAGLLEEEQLVRVFVPPMVGDSTLVELPLRGLGVHHFYLRVHFRVF